MKVDNVSQIEIQKQAYSTNAVGFDFSQWMAYSIGLQLMFAELRRSQLSKKG